MRKLFLTYCFFLWSATGIAQTMENAQLVKPKAAIELNKEQTLAYIEKLYKEAYQYNDVKIQSITLDGKILILKTSVDINRRYDLSKADSLFVGSRNAIGNLDIKYESKNGNQLLCCIPLEADALRLKKALEHLIKLLKNEKSTDPFGN